MYTYLVKLVSHYISIWFVNLILKLNSFYAWIFFDFVSPIIEQIWTWPIGANGGKQNHRKIWNNIDPKFFICGSVISIRMDVTFLMRRFLVWHFVDRERFQPFAIYPITAMYAQPHKTETDSFHNRDVHCGLYHITPLLVEENLSIAFIDR